MGKIDTSKFTRATEEKNPCWQESKISMKCLEENGYNKALCQGAFDNYNVCRKFWNEVRIKRRNAGIEPYIPLPEDRPAMKAKYAETGKIPTTSNG